MPTIWDLQEQRAKKQAAAITACFDFATDSATAILTNVTHARQMASELDQNAFRSWVGGLMHDWCHEHRRELRQLYEDAEADYQVGVEKRRQEIEKELWGSVSTVDPGLILEAAKASEEVLLTMLETARTTGNDATFELTLKVASDRDLATVVARALTGSEELEELYAELLECEKVPVYEDPGSRFDVMAADVPSVGELLLKGEDILALEFGLPKRGAARY
jgi:hypothetical protein